MKQIIGNVDAVIQEKAITRNKIGESVEAWTTKETLKGYLDYQSGEAQTQVVNAKVEQSTHIFICDYQPLAYEEEQIRIFVLKHTMEIWATATFGAESVRGRKAECAVQR